MGELRTEPVETEAEPSNGIKVARPTRAGINWTDRIGIARHLRVCTNTIDDWVKKKVIPVYKRGRVVRFDVDAVDRAMKRFELKAVDCVG